MLTHTCQHIHIYRKKEKVGEGGRRKGGESGQESQALCSANNRVHPQTWPMVITKSLQPPLAKRKKETGSAQKGNQEQSLLPHQHWMRSPFRLPFPSFARELNVYTAWLASMLAGDSRPCWGTEPGSVRPVPICPHPPALLARYRQVWASTGQERPGDLGQCCCFLGPSM